MLRQREKGIRNNLGGGHQCRFCALVNDQGLRRIDPDERKETVGKKDKWKLKDDGKKLSLNPTKRFACRPGGGSSEKSRARLAIGRNVAETEKIGHAPKSHGSGEKKKDTLKKRLGSRKECRASATGLLDRGKGWKDQKKD